MSKLPKFTLSYDEKKKDWALTADGAERARSRFPTKKEATKKGALAEAVGANGGSVKVQKIDGKFQEERTFPRGKDPKSSKG